MSRMSSWSFLVVAAVLGGMGHGCGNADKPQTDGGGSTTDPTLRPPDSGSTTGSDATVPVTDNRGKQCGGTVPTQPGCHIVRQGTADLLIRATILAPDTILHNGTVLLSGEKITCVDCDCANQPGAQAATVIECKDVVVSPGLINPHDHIAYSQNRPQQTDVRYDHRHEWRTGSNDKPKISVPKNKAPNGSGERWGEVRMLLGGATSIMGEGGVDGLLRNLDGDNESLQNDICINETFPLADVKGQLIDSGCNYPEQPKAQDAQKGASYVIHTAEGISAAARNELLCSTAVLSPKTALIHAIGLTTADAQLLAQKQTSVVWSPRSNVSLYGMTADVPLYQRLGINLALGTDWSASGSMNLLRELRCAADLNQNYYNKAFSARQLWQMVTQNAAKVAGAGNVLGALRKDYAADLVLMRNDAEDGKNDPYRAFLAAEPKDVVLVLRAGKALYGRGDLVNALRNKGCEPLDVCGQKQALCLEGETGTTLADLQTAVGNNTYGLFFCGVPEGEPSCIPARPPTYNGQPSGDDPDGDGIKGAADLCPKVFDAVRPIDGKQGRDVDGDGVGDSCDPCPLQADTTDCKTPQPVLDDQDLDGVKDGQDNCAQIGNKDQKDSDGDKVGDACDACPDQPNANGAACLFSIAQLRDASLGKRPSDGTAVRLEKAVVTFVHTKRKDSYGFYVRQGNGPFEAIYIYTQTQLPVDAQQKPLQVGDEVSLNAVMGVFSKIDQLTKPTDVTVTKTNVAAAPIVIAPSELTDKAKAEGWESHVVQLNGVYSGGAVDASKSDHFWISDKAEANCATQAQSCIRVADFVYDGGEKNGAPVAPSPSTPLDVTGVINGFSGNFTIEVRGTDDINLP